ncbi:prolyl oligopeptidase family serine peptidase [Akkermansiaceae bacterium]|nr:prolyl oligopeptidase family serine peptidase [Akkermansiaceae bacterium]
MTRTAYLLLATSLLQPAAFAEHGGTAGWMRETDATRKELVSKVHNERIAHKWSEDGKSFFARIHEAGQGERWYAYDLTTGEREALEKAPGGKASLEKFPARNQPAHRKPVSPDKRWTASLKDGLPLLTPAEGEPPAVAYPLPEGMVWQSNFLWAPDSSAVVLMANTTFPVRKVTYVRSSPEKKIQPEHFTNDYPKPGDKINVPTPVIFFTDGSPPLPLDPELAKNPFQISDLRWHPDSGSLTLAYIERGFGKYRIIEIRPAERAQRILLAEESDKFVYAYGNCHCQHLANGKEILWLSQRTGYNHLYLVKRQTGETIRPLTSGNFVVREVIHVDEAKRAALLSVSGLYPGQDPYLIHFIRVDLDTGKATALTDADGTHSLKFSPDGSHYLAVWSRVDHPPVHEIRRSSDGKMVATLPVPDLTELLATGWQLPQPFVAKDRNGKFDIHGVIFRPAGFDPRKKHPVIENIYAGPHDSFAPKSWSIWSGHRSEMTAAGFIVVQIDGLGTNNRGKEFHEHSYKNLMDAGLPDRIKWMKAAAGKHPEMDISRVGIYGGSAGGQSALAALLNHPDFYKAAAADCGCHDNRMDKIWWNEQWMDWPVDDSYVQNSNLTHIAKLRGELMLTVGEVDTNVDPSSTYQIVNALIEADKDFEYYMVPNGGHGIGESPYLRRKRIGFFRKHLEPE